MSFQTFLSFKDQFSDQSQDIIYCKSKVLSWQSIIILHFGELVLNTYEFIQIHSNILCALLIPHWRLGLGVDVHAYCTFFQKKNTFCTKKQKHWVVLDFLSSKDQIANQM